MDNGTWIYIVISIIFFIVNALTKKKKENGQELDEMGEELSNDEPRRKPVSFEELLREIRQEQQGRNFEETEQEELFDEEPEEAVYPNVEVVDKPTKRSSEIKYYEGTYQADHAYKGKGLVKLDDQVEIDSDKKILNEVEDVAEETASYNRYRRVLKDPQSLKDAIVVSEILRRKEY
ncbi:hypothetical protein KZP23_20595 [Echinicola marina]|uniref:hypothetical protein n=1 Tax=Echinicola marina TaxID=2859768 RepID=UPI001CF653DE|nr:hypothetical protein [Echinicola marina]UCS93031.1 hypothetical protein KZP23_20595 [Echinicola marina]